MSNQTIMGFTAAMEAVAVTSWNSGTIYNCSSQITSIIMPTLIFAGRMTFLPPKPTNSVKAL